MTAAFFTLATTLCKQATKLCIRRTSRWQFGEIGLLAFNGEMYNILQTNLRSAFPDQALIVGTLADGSQCWYLPQSSSYGQGLYQEDASVIARGGLEQLCDATIELFKEG